MELKDLSEDQHEAASSIMTWLDRGTDTKQTLTFAGYAGTGKTTVISVLARQLPQPLAFCAYTGKASSVLARKLKKHGIETTPETRTIGEDGERIDEYRPYCGTIHGLIYWPCRKCRPRDEKKNVDPNIDCSLCDNKRFMEREDLDRPYKLIVCDEASMVSDEMLRAMLSYGVPILAVGDHGQLRPIERNGSLMLNPDIRLEKIHRQAESNPIIALSKVIRESGSLDPNLCNNDKVRLVDKNSMPYFLARSYTPGREDLLSMAIICWTNSMRVHLNRAVRGHLGRHNLPIKGDVVICLKNKPPIYNGMRGVIEGDVVGDDNEKRPKFFTDRVNFMEDDIVESNAAMSALQFNTERTITRERAYELGIAPLSSLGSLYDYGYALTCHKMQGSQAYKIAVVIERGQQRFMDRKAPDEYARWLYTAVTRSSDRLVIFQ
jgi:exodeoxyribonuclease V